MNWVLFEFALGFFLIFVCLQFVFKQRINLKNFLVLELVFLWLIFSKTDLGLLRGNVDPEFHLSYLNGLSGFPVFFWVQFVLDFITGNAFFWLPLLFGCFSFYVLLVWLNERKVNLFVLFFSCFVFSPVLLFLFSFSRESVIVFFSLGFLFFLEKYFYLNDLKALHWSLVFLALSVLTKLTSIFLLLFCLLVLLQKRSKLKYFVVLFFMFGYLFLFTNLSGNLSLNVNFNNFFVSFPLFFFACSLLSFVLLKPFFKPKNFLWQFTFFGLIVLFLLELLFGFLRSGDPNAFDLTIRRYGLVFFFPAILWLSSRNFGFIRELGFPRFLGRGKRLKEKS